MTLPEGTNEYIEMIFILNLMKPFVRSYKKYPHSFCVFYWVYKYLGGGAIEKEVSRTLHHCNQSRDCLLIIIYSTSVIFLRK